MAGIEDKINHELKLIDEVKADAEELLNQLKPHKRNMDAVRGWRLNIGRNISRLQQVQKKSLSEDALAQLRSAQKGYNSTLDELTLSVRSDMDGKLYQDFLEDYKGSLTKLQETAGFDQQEDWESEVAEIDHQVAQDATKVAEFRQKWQKVQKDKSKIEDKKKEAIATLKSELGEGLSPYVKGVDDTKNQRITAKFDEDIKNEFELDKSWLNEAITAFIDDQDDTPEQEFIYQVVQENFSGRLAVLQEAVLDEIYFPANPQGKQLGTLDTDTPYQDLVKKVKGQLESVEPVSYRVRPSINPLHLRVTARLSSPKGKVEEEPTLPQNVAEELLELTRGPYKDTLAKADTINEYSGLYGTLPLEVEQVTVTSGVEDLIAKTKLLTYIANSFTEKHNSSEGIAVVAELNSAITRLERSSRNQYISFRNSLQNFEEASEHLRVWIKTRFYQFGGQPRNHKFSGKSSGDSRENVTYTSTPQSNLNTDSL